jgi:Protein of unknown function (DUF1549)/Protein of unknown function (DUF1553)
MYLLPAAALAMLTDPAAADPRVTRLIDEQITARHRAENVAPATRADDAALLRRIYLDLLGRSPSASEAEAFFNDPAQDKVHRLIDRLRLYPETAAHWRRVISGWLLLDSSREADSPLLGYLANAVANNRGWDQVARDLIDPERDNAEQRGAAEYLGHFIRTADVKAGRDAATVAVASAFFGAQLQCARCHDHPTVPEWTKAHFDGLRAFFDRTVTDRKDRALTLSEMPQRRDGEKLMFLDGKKFDPSPNPRAELARHAFRPQAVHFKRAVVNRVWQQFIGRGLVEPVDMIHEANPGSHPQLLSFLADDFSASGFNFDRLIASIMHSDVYLRSARWTGPAERRPADELFAVARMRPLSGAQMAWTVAVATGYAKDIVTAANRAGALVVPGQGLPLEARSYWEASAGFAKFTDVFRDGPGRASTARHAIFLTFDALPKSLLEPKPGRLVGTLVEEPDDEVMAGEAYLAILNRQPTVDETATAKEHMRAAKSRVEGCRDLVWALIASAEFRFNH